MFGSIQKKLAVALGLGLLASSALAGPPSAKNLMPQFPSNRNQLPAPVPPVQQPIRPHISGGPTGPSGGIIQIHKPDGRGVIVEGGSHGGGITIIVPTNIGAGGKK